MKYMVLLKMSEEVGPPTPALMDAMGELMGQAAGQGNLLDAGGLAPVANSTVFTVRGGALDRADGPYTEVAEVVGGYALFDVRSPDEAIELARRMMQCHQQHWPGWQGEAEVRQVFGADDAAGA